MNNSSKMIRLVQAARTKHKQVARVRADEYIDTEGDIPRDFIRMEPWEIRYLYSVCTHARHRVVEIGRFKGGSTLIAAHATQLPIFSVDLAPQDDIYLQHLMQVCGVGTNVTLVVGDSQKTKYNVGPYDVLFVDGDHSYEGCLNDLNNWWDELAPGGHVVCHDCYLGKHSGEGVQDAVCEFLKDKQVNIFLTPYIQQNHWALPHGSLCHFQKPL